MHSASAGEVNDPGKQHASLHNSFLFLGTFIFLTASSDYYCLYVASGSQLFLTVDKIPSRRALACKFEHFCVILQKALACAHVLELKVKCFSLPWKC